MALWSNIFSLFGLTTFAFDTDFPGFINCAIKILDFFFLQYTKGRITKCLFCYFVYDFLLLLLFFNLATPTTRSRSHA